MKGFLLLHRYALPKAVLALFALVMVSCASAPVPTEKLAVAVAAVERANTASTRESAPAELQVAIEKLASAQEAAARKDNERAEQLAEQTILDAQLAELSAQAVRAGIAARETESAARALRTELNR